MIVSAAILPHGDVIPEIAGPNAPLTLPTHLAMTEAGRRMSHAQPDTVVIATPHGMRIEEHIGITMTQHAAGTIYGHGASATVDMPVDQELAFAIAAEAQTVGLPVAKCVFGSSYGPESRMPLDWGCVTPLWYCGAGWPRSPKVVVVVPSRSAGDENIVRFGRAIAAAATRAKKRVAFIASCDWAHAHSKDGPYGYHPDAARFDNAVKEIIRQNDLLRFLHMDEKFIENAKPDGNWQTLMLAGAIEQTQLKPDLLSYQCPTYFGMLVASYQ